jgi:hypothetical protein
MTVDEGLIFIAILIGLCFLFRSFLDFVENNAKKTWWVVGEGTYINSDKQYISSDIATRMTGYYVSLPAMVFTTIFFEDNPPLKVINVDKLPPPGTRIRVIKNKRADFEIETLP